MRTLAQQPLRNGFAATQCVETNVVSPQIDFGADEAMRPQGVHRKGVSQQARCSVLLFSHKTLPLTGNCCHLGDRELLPLGLLTVKS